MPWKVKQDAEMCPADKPWAVVKADDGTKVSCHESQASAEAQVKVLDAGKPAEDKNPFAAGAIRAGKLENIEIARPGNWHLVTGDLTVTETMLRDAAEFAQLQGSAFRAPVHLGHSDPRFDGEPALGWLQNLRVESAEGDTVLRGDIVDMPEWLVEAAPKHWPDRSMEGWQNVEVGDRTYAMVLDGLALLGVTPPGMETVRSLRDLPQALGIAASQRIAATMSVAAPEVPSPKVEVGNEEGAGMDPVKMREALGLPADASDDEVRAALVADTTLAVQAAQVPPVSPVPPKKKEDEGEGVPNLDESTLRQLQAAGAVVVDKSILQELQERGRKGDAAYAMLQQRDRDTILEGAIKAGKFPPSRREHWQKLYDADPDGTRAQIDRLAAGLVPTGPLGIAGDIDLDHESESIYRDMFGEAKN